MWLSTIRFEPGTVGKDVYQWLQVPETRILYIVTGCTLHSELTTSFMRLGDSAGQSVRQKRLIWSGSDANSEGIYNFVVNIKFMPVADCVSVQVPYLSTTRRDVPKEWSCLACLLLLVFSQQKPHRCHRVIRLLRGHGSSYWRLPEDLSGRCGLEVWLRMRWDSERWKNITRRGYG